MIGSITVYTIEAIIKVNYILSFNKVLVHSYSPAVTLASSRSLAMAAEGTSVRSAALCRNSEIERPRG